MTAFTLLTLVGPPPSDAAEPCLAGDTRLDADDPAGAIALYEAALPRPDCADERPRIRVNLAFARDRLARQTGEGADYCAAVDAYRRARTGASASVAAAIEPALADMSARCVRPATLIVACTPPGATLHIEALGAPRPCPTRYEGVEPGRYTGVATAAGVERPFSVLAVPGETAEVTVDLRDPIAEPAPPDLLTSAPPLPNRGLAPYAWTGVGLTVVAAGVATYASLEARDLADDAAAIVADRQRAAAAWGQLEGTDRRAQYDSFSAQGTATAARYAEVTDDYDTARALAIGAWVGAGVFAVTATTLFILDTRPPEVTPAVEVAPGGVRVRF